MQLTAITSSSSCRNSITPILRVMKLTAILLTIACLHVSARGHSQTITLSVKDAPLTEVLGEIKKQSGYSFLYNDKAMEGTKRISLKVTNMQLQEVLELCFKNQPLSYIIENKTIILIKNEIKNKPVVIENTINNGIVISGRVTGSDGLPLGGASIVTKRTGRGTQTDNDGLFEIKNGELNDELTVSSVGYNSKTVKVETEKRIFIVLDVAVNELDKVVIIAYGKTTQRYSTGNVAKVTSEEIEKQPVMNPLLALQGRVAGVDVKQNNGYAAAPIKISIRGTNIIPLPGVPTATEPLYVVDGVPFTIGGPGGNEPNGSTVILSGFSPAGGQSPFFGIDPSTIESIEVLKDADATAIYGSRGANGVILITTKKGSAGALKVSAGFEQGISKVSSKRWQMLNTQEYLKIRREAFANDTAFNVTPMPYNAPDLLILDQNRYTDWQGYIFDNGTGNTSNARVNVSWGNTQTQVFFGAGYGRFTDVLTVSGENQRGSIQIGLNQKFSDKLRATFSLNSTFSKNDLINLGTGATLLPPNAPSVFDSTGKLNWNEWSPIAQRFPFADLLRPYTGNTINLISNLQLSYKIAKGLEFRTSLGYTRTQVDVLNLSPDYSFNPIDNMLSSSSFGFNTIKNWIIEPQAEYSTFISKGRLNILIGSSLQENSTRGFSIDASGYANNALMRSLTAAANIYISSDNLYQYRYAGIFGRINYNWENKYIINLNARRDGSSRFGQDNRFGNFGSVGAAWIFTEESIIKKNLRFLSFGKLRGSYGIVGSDGVRDYAYLSQWSGNGLFQFNNSSSPIPLLTQQNQLNPNYHWQTNKKLEGAIEIGVWKDRVLASFAYYRNRCDNQLISTPLAYTAGIPVVINNSPASVENSGWEFLLNAKIIDGKNFKWSINFNTGKNKNKLIAFPDLENSIYAKTYIIGESINLQRVLHYTGVDPQTGLRTFEDKNKDGVISTEFGETDDRYIVSRDPKFTGGVGINISWKGLQLSGFFNIVKQDGYNAIASLSPAGYMFNLPKDILGNYWQKPGDVKEYPKLTTLSQGDPNYSKFLSSDGVFTDASFIRLQNLSLDYTLANHISKKIGLENCRVFLHAQNLFVITKYKGVDPETQNFGGMPPLKTFTGGIQITL